MSLPTTRTAPAESGWRAICFDVEHENAPTMRWIKLWTISRVPAPDGGFGYELGFEFTTLPGCEDEDAGSLTPWRLIPPTVPNPTLDDVKAEFSSDAEFPYAMLKHGTTKAILREIEAGDNRLLPVVQLAQRGVVGWSIEKHGTGEVRGIGSGYLCPDCELVFSDAWAAATHRGQVHRRADASVACEVCGLNRCDTPLGEMMHAHVITNAEAVNA